MDRREHFTQEKTRIIRLSHIRELVFGAQDGLLVPLGVVSGVAGAFFNNHIVIVAGIAEGLAGAFSMATGAFLAAQAQEQVHQAAIEHETRLITANKEDEIEEMVALFEHDGVPRANAEIIVANLMTSNEAFTKTMVQKELGLDPDSDDSALRDAMLVGCSYLVNAAVPLLPYFFLPAGRAIYISILLTLCALFTLGLLKARVAQLDYLKSGLQVLLVGALSGVGGYLLGTVLPKILHLQ